MKAGHRDAALEEIKRFIVIGHSDEYTRLIKEMDRSMREEDENRNGDSPTFWRAKWKA
jgi:hypothetical protein